jgi:hypothetical protein
MRVISVGGHGVATSCQKAVADGHAASLADLPHRFLRQGIKTWVGIEAVIEGVEVHDVQKESPRSRADQIDDVGVGQLLSGHPNTQVMSFSKNGTGTVAPGLWIFAMNRFGDFRVLWHREEIAEVAGGVLVKPKCSL